MLGRWRWYVRDVGASEHFSLACLAEETGWPSQACLNGATHGRQLCRRKPDEAASRRPPSLWLPRRDRGVNPP
jgi:hypothetical protein